MPYQDGECLVGLAPESRRWAMAMMSPAGPGEPEGPSWYHITPPDPSWPEQDAQDWLCCLHAIFEGVDRQRTVLLQPLAEEGADGAQVVAQRAQHFRGG